jgi:hypothetical protein
LSYNIRDNSWFKSRSIIHKFFYIRIHPRDSRLKIAGSGANWAASALAMYATVRAHLKAFCRLAKLHIIASILIKKTCPAIAK